MNNATLSTRDRSYVLNQRAALMGAVGTLTDKVAVPDDERWPVVMVMKDCPEAREVWD